MYCAGNPVMLIDPDGKDIWKLGKNNKLTLAEKNDDKFNTFIDSDGNEIFRTNEKMEPKKGENWNSRMAKVDIIMGEISNKENGVFKTMKSRAKETGFDNSIFKGGIDEFKQAADSWKNGADAAKKWGYVKDGVVGAVTPSSKAQDVYGIISKVYESVTNGSKLTDDLWNGSIETVKKIPDEISKSVSSGLKSINDFFNNSYNELKRSIEHGAKTGRWP
jgi:hypothetical protein